MANDLNQCNFIGRLGNDPSVKYAQSGMCITNFSIAVGWKSKDKEGTEWVNVVAFDKLGELVGEYCRKGSRVFVTGRFKTEKYEKDGQERYATKIIADTVQFLGGKQEGQGGGSGGSRGGAPQRERPQRATDNPPMDDFADDDIPFISNRGNF